MTTSCSCRRSVLQFLGGMVLLSLSWFALVRETEALHLQGTWKIGSEEEFFRFLGKFGFQRTSQHDRINTQGYIFGNITARTPQSSSNSNASLLPTADANQFPATFVVVDRTYFEEFYGNATLPAASFTESTSRCPAMFKKIDTIAYDAHCFQGHPEDFLRRIPCPLNGLCVDEDQPKMVVPGFQFTYGVQDINQPRFWFVSLVSCHRTGNCTWANDGEVELEIDYDVWLVNGNPYTRHQNPLEYQFSFDRQDTVEMYLVFMVLYLCLTCVQARVAVQQRHPITHLFTGTIAMGLLANVLHSAHVLAFASDGQGMESVDIVGDVCDLLSQTGFVLVLLLLAKGFAVTQAKPSWRRLLFVVWSGYLALNLALHVWNMQSNLEAMDDFDPFWSWAGRLSLVLRMLTMFWFLYELRKTMQKERNKAKLQFLLHFGASSLVWFIYMPMLAIVATNVSDLWRFKLTLGISSSVNFLALASMTHLLWPVRHETYVHLNDVATTDELEEFDEAPHVVNYHKHNPHNLHLNATSS